MIPKRFFNVIRLVGLLLLVVFSLKFSESIARGIVSLKREYVAKECLEDSEDAAEQEAEKIKKSKKFSLEIFVVSEMETQEKHCWQELSLCYRHLECVPIGAICCILKPPPDNVL